MWSGNYKLAIRSLRSSKWRSTLTMLGIIIGVSSVVTVVSLGEGLKGQIVGQIDNLGKDVISVRPGTLVNRDNSGGISDINLLAFLSASTLTEQDTETLSKLPAVSQVAPMEFVTSSATVNDKQVNNLFIIGTSPDLPRLLRQKVEYGGFFGPEDTDRKIAVIGSNVAQNLFGQLNPVGLPFDIKGQTFTVAGVLAPSAGGLLSVAQTDFNSAVFIPTPQANGLTDGHSNILQILIKNKPGQNLDTTVASVTKTLKTNHEGQKDFTVLKQYELLDIAGSIVNNFTGFISGIAAISLLVGGIGIMDIMLLSVTERRREIGIRKAVGATNRQILNQFLAEGLALSLVGGVIGMGLAFLVSGSLRIYTSLHPAVTWPVVVIAVGVSVGVGVIFSAAPALKAARKNPIDALRGE